MVERKSGNEVKRWEIQNHFRNLEWEELIKLCDEISFELNDLEKSYQVRALYNHGN